MRLLEASVSEDEQRRVAGALAARGLRAGDRLVLVLPSSASLLSVVLGALRSGIVPVLVNPFLLPHERAAVVADADGGVVVDDDDMLAALFDGPPAELAAVPLARPMHYTSGTTGRPRGVWSGLLDESDGGALVDEEASLWDIDGGDVHLVCSPLQHSAPLRFATTTLLRGGRVVVLERFEAGAFAAAVDAWRPTTAFVVPAHLARLLGPDAPELPDVSSFRLVAHAGAACPEGLKRAAMAAFPESSVWEFYGSTEGQFTACSPDEWMARPGTVGRARPGRRLSVDPDGIVWCEPPAHARFSYWRDPEATAAAWRDGSFTVGDLGHLDQDGFLYLDGRRDDLIVSGGVNVRPLEVERVLASLPGVQEVAVFGVPDERWGQRVCAAVVGDADADAVLAHARTSLAPHKRPKEVVVVAELPRAAMGKVRRSTLADALGLA